ncbi:hypothetical protein FJZ19_01035 [Candidatus Pacearchaeota archaeon]|nr:hypothetical protein [Candidatus Pacearchaeota archaeon]
MTEQSWYNKWYKILLFPPIIILFLCLIYLGFFYSQHNDIMLRDISLTGGTTITLTQEVPADFEQSLKQEFSDVNFRKLTELNSGKQIAIIIESSLPSEQLKEGIEKILGYSLTDENSSIEYTGSSLGKGFYIELAKTVLLAFILMALVIFLIFGESNRLKAISAALSLIAIKLTFPASLLVSVLVVVIGISALVYSIIKSKNKKQYLYPCIVFLILIISFIFPVYYFIFPIAILIFVTYLFQSIPSIAVIFAAFCDIIIALVFIDIIGLKLSAAGIAAFLMLIGYSVDTDILLTTRALRKRESSLNQRIYGAFKTGILMTLTALAAVLPAFFLVTGLPESFRQIFLILAIGLFADIFSTWLTNASIIKWYCDKKGIT